MMLEEKVLSNSSDHPATLAWKQATRGGDEVRHVEVIEEGRGNKRLTTPAVYRLVFMDAPEAIVAKKCRHVTAKKERLLYDGILPRLSLPALRCLGTLEDCEGPFSWLFLEDAGSRLPRLDREAAQVGKWLGLLHTSAADAPERYRLPEHGPRRYRSSLQSGTEKIGRHLTNTALEKEDVVLLRTILLQTEKILRGWDTVEEYCAKVPCTLVHGDFVTKNMRLRMHDETEVLVFDWSTSACTVPAVDIGALVFDSQSTDWAAPDTAFGASLNDASLDFLKAYWSVVRHHWPDVDFPMIVDLAKVGTLLRCIVAIEWEAEGLAYPWVERAMRRMRIYSRRLAGWVGVY